MIDKRNEAVQGVVALIASTLVLSGMLYLDKADDYRYVYNPGTIINGVDYSGADIGQVEEDLSQYTLEVSFRDGESAKIEGDEIGYHYVPDGTLNRILKEQNPLLWALGLYQNTEYRAAVNTTFDVRLLKKALREVPQLKKKNMIPPKDSFLDYQDGKFVVTKEVEGTTLDPEQVTELITAAVTAQENELDLTKKDGIYSAPSIRQTDEDLCDEAEQLNDLAGARIDYELPDGSHKVLDGPVLREWLEVDEDGDYYRDDDIWYQSINAFVQELADEVDTVYSEHPFITHDGDEVMLPGAGYYGYLISKKEETEQLTDELDENEQLSREPVYWRREVTTPDDNNGFGDTYVEVDLTDQHLWVYIDGEVELETDIVSGTNDREHRTPAGAYFAYDKKTDTILRGDKQDDGEWGYETHVDYWVRLTDTGIGLHDASWRYSFGGNIWRWSGSHGCINIPKQVMPELYDLVEDGMPVAVYYLE